MERIEQFVSYNIALALKELGFDEECFGWSFVDSKTLHIEYISNQAEPYMVRPLWQQAIDWFREKYDINIEFTMYYYHGKWVGPTYKYIIDKISRTQDGHESEIELSFFQEVYQNQNGESDYRKSRELAILKAIEIIKTRNYVKEM